MAALQELNAAEEAEENLHEVRSVKVYIDYFAVYHSTVFQEDKSSIRSV